MSVFFDTNVLVYAVDRSEPERRVVALGLLEGYAGRGSAKPIFKACSRTAAMPTACASRAVAALSDNSRAVRTCTGPMYLPP